MYLQFVKVLYLKNKKNIEDGELMRMERNPVRQRK